MEITNPELNLVERDRVRLPEELIAMFGQVGRDGVRDRALKLKGREPPSRRVLAFSSRQPARDIIADTFRSDFRSGLGVAGAEPVAGLVVELSREH